MISIQRLSSCVIVGSRLTSRWSRPYCMSHSPILLKMLTIINFFFKMYFLMCVLSPALFPLPLNIVVLWEVCAVPWGLHTKPPHVRCTWTMHLKCCLVGSSSFLSLFSNEWVYKMELEFHLGHEAKSWIYPCCIFITLEHWKMHWVFWKKKKQKQFVKDSEEGVWK